MISLTNKRQLKIWCIKHYVPCSLDFIGWVKRKYYLLATFRNHADSLNKRVEVENYLFDCASGKRPLPDMNKCRELAMKLGVPSYFNKGKK